MNRRRRLTELERRVPEPGPTTLVDEANWEAILARLTDEELGEYVEARRRTDGLADLEEASTEDLGVLYRYGKRFEDIARELAAE